MALGCPAVMYSSMLHQMCSLEGTSAGNVAAKLFILYPSWFTRLIASFLLSDWSACNTAG